MAGFEDDPRAIGCVWIKADCVNIRSLETVASLLHPKNPPLGTGDKKPPTWQANSAVGPEDRPKAAGFDIIACRKSLLVR